MKQEIIVFGCGDHAKSVIDCIETQDVYHIAAIVGSPMDVGKTVCGIEVHYTDEDMPLFLRQGINKAFLAIGSIECSSVRKKIWMEAKKKGFSFVNIIDKSAVVSSSVHLGEGILIGKKCVVNTSATIGDMVILNSGSIVEHDCMIGDFTHIAPGAVLCGRVEIGSETFIGANTTIANCRRIGKGSLIGAGSVVIKDIGEHKKAYGNPCREMDVY